MGNLSLITFVHDFRGPHVSGLSWLLICPHDLCPQDGWWAFYNFSVLQGCKLVYFTMSRDRCASMIHTCVPSARRDPTRKSHPVIISSKWHTHLSQFFPHTILKLQICHWVHRLINRYTETPPGVPTLKAAVHGMPSSDMEAGIGRVSLNNPVSCKILVISAPQMQAY